MRIGIYDTEHYETTYALIRIFDVPENSITLFLTVPVASVLKDLLGKDAERYTWVTKKTGSIVYHFKIFQVCTQRKIDILFLSTVSYHHLLVAILCFFIRKTKTVLTVHDANSFYRPKFSLHFRKGIRYTGIKLLSGVVSAYSTLLSTTQRVLKEKIGIRKPVYCIPGGIFENKITNTEEQDRPLRIVIPGSIEGKRRDYDKLFELVKELEPVKDNLEIILLGTASGEYGREVIERCKKIRSKNITVKFYTEKFIEQHEFDEQISNSHFVFIPLVKVSTMENGVLEEYGVTKASGGFFDAIRFGKPVIVPAYITLAEEIKEQCIVYSSIFELSQFINEIISGTINYSDYLQQSVKNSQNFSPDNIRQAMLHVLSK